MTQRKNKNAAFMATEKTQTIAATSTSANVQIQTGSVVAEHVRVFNYPGSDVVWINFGNANTVTASSTCPTNSIPLMPGTTMILTAPFSWAAAVTPTTATVYFTPGDGGV